MAKLTKLLEVPDRGAMTIAEFSEWSGLSTSTVYNLINSGDLTARKVGSRSVVTLPDAMDWLTGLPKIKPDTKNTLARSH